MNDNDNAIADLLKRFVRFGAQPQAELLALSQSVDIQVAQPGTKLFCAGDSDEIDFFLVSGELQLIAADGRSHCLTATSEAARHPISRLRPRRYTAVANSLVEYFVAGATTVDIGASSQPVRTQAIDVMEISAEAYENAVAAYQQHRAAP